MTPLRLLFFILLLAGYTEFILKYFKMRIFKTLLVILIFFSLLLSSCDRLSPVPAFEYRTAQPQGEATDIPPVQTSLPLDPVVEQVLRIFPLHVGSSWVYLYLGYDQRMEVVWRVVERVMDTYYLEGYYIAELERTVSLLEGQPSEDFLANPTPETFWYLLDGEHIYLFTEHLHTDLTGAWLDLIIPFPQNNQAWYPNPDQRALLEPRTVGFRTASDPFKRVLPMGGTYTCYNIATHYTDGRAESTFCETVGFVFQEYDYGNFTFGFRSEMIDFSSR